LDYFTYQERPVFDMTLNFPLLRALTRLDATLARDLWEWDADLPAHAWLGNFASNHDLAADRPGTLFADEPLRQRAQAAWLLLGPGTPFVYYGNEIGQPQGPERGDVKHRKPLDWQEVARQRDDAGSLWHWHRRLIELRREHASIRRGKAQFLKTNAGPELLALWRETEGDTTLTLLNGSADTLDELTVTLPETPTVITPRWLLGEGPPPKFEGVDLDAGSLAPYETRVLVFK
jgi:alpha-glucosidase